MEWRPAEACRRRREPRSGSQGDVDGVQQRNLANKSGPGIPTVSNDNVPERRPEDDSSLSMSPLTVAVPVTKVGTSLGDQTTSVIIDLVTGCRREGVSLEELPYDEFLQCLEAGVM